jgi:hypothetical protein
MKAHLTLVVICLFSLSCSKSVTNPINPFAVLDAAGLPYSELPSEPNSFTAENAAARMIDGLGFRFYWATEGLTKEDLEFRPSARARSSEETIDHIMGLAIVLKNAIQNKENFRSGEESSPLNFADKRKLTLDYLKGCSLALRSGTLKIQDINIIFVSPENKRTAYNFWYLLNGPIADALWHVGQIVSFRRSSGNPFNDKVSVLSGKLRE